MRERVAAAILAAGSSQRLGEDKVIADLGGVPVVCWSIAAADASGVFDEILVVANPMRFETIENAVRRRYRSVRVVPGGATRTASSWAALDSTDADVIAIHDAARPFVPPSLFARCVASAKKEGSGVAGMPLADTVRRADEAGMSVEELEREGLWQVQTPQAFRRDVLEQARASTGARSFTDDAAAVVAAGGRTRMVPGERGNLKITTAEDLGYARELVAKELAFIAGKARSSEGPASPARASHKERSDSPRASRRRADGDRTA